MPPKTLPTRLERIKETVGGALDEFGRPLRVAAGTALAFAPEIGGAVLRRPLAVGLGVAGLAALPFVGAERAGEVAEIAAPGAARLAFVGIKGARARAKAAAAGRITEEITEAALRKPAPTGAAARFVKTATQLAAERAPQARAIKALTKGISGELAQAQVIGKSLEALETQAARVSRFKTVIGTLKKAGQTSAELFEVLRRSGVEAIEAVNILKSAGVKVGKKALQLARSPAALKALLGAVSIPALVSPPALAAEALLRGTPLGPEPEIIPGQPALPAPSGPALEAATDPLSFVPGGLRRKARAPISPAQLEVLLDPLSFVPGRLRR